MTTTNVALRVLAVAIFLGFVLAGTYFAKVSTHPRPLIGFILAGIGVGLSRLFWSISGGRKA